MEEILDNIIKEKGIISDFFPTLTKAQQAHFNALGDLYTYWNASINVISRKDLPHLYQRHILHSIALAKILSFEKEATILDLGTGGGFPGIPLAILFPDTQFHLVDSRGKKIKVVKAVSNALGLKNVTPLAQRAETLTTRYDFVLSRAVAKTKQLYAWTHDKLKTKHRHKLPNGLVCWKGGDISGEIAAIPLAHKVYKLEKILPFSFFKDKMIVHFF